MIPTIIRVSKESWYLVWTALLRDAKREASTVNFPALDGLSSFLNLLHLEKCSLADV